MRSNRYFLQPLLLLLLLLSGASLAAQSTDTVWTLRQRNRAIYRVAFSPDSRYLALISFDGMLDVRDVATGELIWSEQQQDSTTEYAGLAFSPDGTSLGYALAPTMKVWDIHSGALLAHADYPPDGNRYLSSNFQAVSARTDSLGWLLVVRQLPAGDTIAVVRVHIESAPMALRLSPDGDHVAIGTYHGEVLIYNTATGDLLLQKKLKNGIVGVIAFSPDGKYIAVNGPNILLVDMITGEVVKSMNGNGGTALEFSSDGRYLISGSRNDSVRVWDVGTGETVHTYNAGPIYYDYSAAISPDMRYILTSSLGGTVILWNARYTTAAGIEHPASERSGELSLTGNAPNPFSSETTIGFRLASPQRVIVEVFDLYGDRVATLADEMMEAGEHAVSWNAAGLPAGLYHYRLRAGETSVSGRMGKVR